MSHFLDPEQIAKYHHDGFLILKNYLPIGIIKQLLRDLESMIGALAKQRGIWSTSLLDQSLIDLHKKDNNAAIAFYQAMTRLMALKTISSLDIIRQVATDLIGSNSLFVSGESLRYDLPSKDDLLIDWHQDYPYYTRF